MKERILRVLMIGAFLFAIVSQLLSYDGDRLVWLLLSIGVILIILGIQYIATGKGKPFDLFRSK